jgi:glutathione S-transferase
MILAADGLGSVALSSPPEEDRASSVFRAMNPLGQIPVLQDGDLTLADSNAILVYLVRRYAPDSAWLPTDPVGSARLQRWFSIAAGELRFGLAAARIIALFNPQADQARDSDRESDPASQQAVQGLT